MEEQVRSKENENLNERRQTLENGVRTRLKHTVGIIGQKFTFSSTSGYRKNEILSGLWGTMKRLTLNADGK